MLEIFYLKNIHQNKIKLNTRKGLIQIPTKEKVKETKKKTKENLNKRKTTYTRDIQKLRRSPDHSAFNEKEYYPVYPAILASHNVEVCNNKAKRTLQVLLSRRRRCIRRLRVLVEIFEERGRESWFVERCSKGE